MYIRITSKCNMRCVHCCFSCTDKGSFMSKKTFIAACKIAKDHGDHIFIGGGEPTLHPQLFEFIGIAMSYDFNDNDFHVGIVTNGSMVEESLKLANMAKRGLICARLSLDVYHSPISNVVIKAFTKDKQESRLREYQTGENHDYRDISLKSSLVAAGRAKHMIEADTLRCCCDDVVIEPSGKVFECGCRKVSPGYIQDNVDISHLIPGMCYKERIDQADE